MHLLTCLFNRLPISVFLYDYISTNAFAHTVYPQLEGYGAFPARSACCVGWGIPAAMTAVIRLGSLIALYSLFAARCSSLNMTSLEIMGK